MRAFTQRAAAVAFLLMGVLSFSESVPAYGQAGTKIEDGVLDSIHLAADPPSGGVMLAEAARPAASSARNQSAGEVRGTPSLIFADGFESGNTSRWSATEPPVPPTCSYGPDDFHGGLNGYCSQTGEQTFDLYFKDWNGVEVYSIDWPGDLADPPQVDCEILCEAGANAIAYETDRLNLQRPDETFLPWKSLTGVQLAPAPDNRACPLQPNANETYYQCVGGGSFRCFLACGKGCVGCEVSMSGDCSQDGQTCQFHDFKCYKRPCCVTHDNCLATATSRWQRFKCHVQALGNGCNLADARGSTHGEADATCFNPPQQCLKIGG